MATLLTDIGSIVTAATGIITDLNLLPFVLVGGVTAAVGMVVRAAKKIGR